MTITTRVQLDRREIMQDGVIQVRFSKQVVGNDGSVMSAEWHRAALPPGFDLAQARGAINASLTSLGYPEISDADWQLVSDTAALEWTPAVVAAFKAAEAP